jgi:hypothetical protein
MSLSREEKLHLLAEGEEPKEQEELTLVKEFLEKYDLRHEVTTATLSRSECLNDYRTHTTIWIPSKENHKTFISFTNPFDGYRIYNVNDDRYDNDIDGVIEYLSKKYRKEVKQNGRKKV